MSRLSASSSPRRAAAASQAGFTLVELLVVLAIMAMLAGLVAPRVMEYFGRAKVDTAKLQVENIAAAMELHRLDVGRYPSAQEGLQALVAPSGAPRWQGPYLQGGTVPLDPWGRPYRYRIPGTEGRAFDVYSPGPSPESGDGAPARGVIVNRP
jgi:general secretion pathway protein G